MRAIFSIRTGAHEAEEKIVLIGVRNCPLIPHHAYLQPSCLCCELRCYRIRRDSDNGVGNRRQISHLEQRDYFPR